MASKSSASQRAQQSDSEFRQDANEQMTDMARQQLAFTEEWMARMFRAGESLQRTQQQFSERAALLHSQAAENLRKAANPAELAYIQSNLLLSWIQDASRLYLDMMMVGAKLGSQTLRPSAGAAGAQTVETATDAASAAMNAAAPMMQAWQMLFTAPLDASQSMRH